MTKLEYTFTTDTLFKTLFVQYPELLKKLVAELRVFCIIQNTMHPAGKHRPI
jgi:hypothetical protein